MSCYFNSPHSRYTWIRSEFFTARLVGYALISCELFVAYCQLTPFSFSGTDRTNVCWVKEGCSSLKPAACSSLPLEVVDHVNEFDASKLNLHLNKGCYSGNNLQAQLDNAPASCNPPCFRITKPGEYCYMSTRNNNFSNRRHIGQITVTQSKVIE